MAWTVLCVSKISPAQITRNMILERAGYQVVAIDDSGEAERIFKTSVADAVVFGDSINGEQRLALARTFKAVNSTVPIVALNKTGSSRMPAGLIDEQLESLGDPHLLVEALNRALSRDGDGAAQAAPHHKQALQDCNNPVKPASSFTDGQASNTKSDSKTQKIQVSKKKKQKLCRQVLCRKRKKRLLPISPLWCWKRSQPASAVLTR